MKMQTHNGTEFQGLKIPLRSGQSTRSIGSIDITWCTGRTNLIQPSVRLMQLERVSAHLARPALPAPQRELETAHAFEHFGFARCGGKRQPHAGFIGGMDVKKRARDVEHVLLDRALEYISGMTAALQPRPHEHAALRRDVFNVVRNELPQRVR